MHAPATNAGSSQTAPEFTAASQLPCSHFWPSSVRSPIASPEARTAAAVSTGRRRRLLTVAGPPPRSVAGERVVLDIAVEYPWRARAGAGSRVAIPWRSSHRPYIEASYRFALTLRPEPTTRKKEGARALSVLSAPPS
jgi:hypothetical protein